jgi:hypothetical protein
VRTGARNSAMRWPAWPGMRISKRWRQVSILANRVLCAPKGGRPSYPTGVIIKFLALQQLYDLADSEYQLLDRRSFLRFLDLTESRSIVDVKTIWLFRDRLAQASLGNRGRIRGLKRSWLSALLACSTTGY